MKYKLVIFDLDGTLLNTAPDIQKNLNTALQTHGLPVLSLQRTIEYVGHGAKNLVERAVGDRCDKFEEVYATFSRLYAESDNGLTTFYEGEAEMLNALKQAGVKLAILTNKPQAATQTVYAQKLSSFGFDFVMGKQDGFAVKPDPQSAQYIMKKFGVAESDCVFVGDGETDVQTAINAKMDGVAVLWGYRSQEQLRKAGANKFANSCQQLQNILLGK